MTPDLLPRPARPRRLLGALAVVLSVTGVVGAARTIAPAFTDHGHWRQADVTADWVVTKGAWTGHDPYGDTAQLGRELGTTIADRAAIASAAVEAPHPRPPGAFVVLAPLALLDAGQALRASAVFNVLLCAVIAALGAIATRRSLRAAAVGVAIALNATAVRDALGWGTLSFFMAALIMATFVACRRGDGIVAGIPLGIAAALKLFPLALVIPLVLFGRRRAGAAAATTFVVLSLGGLALPGVEFGRAVHALSGASDAWIGSPGNASLAGLFVQTGLTPAAASLLALGFGAVAFAALARRARGWPDAYWWVALLALLLSPISWRHYDGAVALGAVLVITEGRAPAARRLATAYLAMVVLSGLFVSAFELNHYGEVALLERLVLLAGFAMVASPVRVRAGAGGEVAPAAVPFCAPPTAHGAVAGAQFAASGR